jgi:predicted MFS family arabinose efflux permease
VVFGWAWPIFGAAAAASTVAAAAFSRYLSSRRLWVISHVAMAVGVALPLVWSGIASIMTAALLVGGTFMVTTMVAIKEARDVAGVHAKALIAAMTTAFAIGQIVGPLAAAYAIRVAGTFSPALVLASCLLVVSAYLLTRGEPRYLLS